MRDQNEFMRQMLELVDFAKASGGRLTKKQVRDFCSNLALTGPQLNLVYEFLNEHNVEVSGFSAVEGDSPGSTDGMNHKDSQYVRIYRRELRGLPEYTVQEKEELYERLLRGEEDAVHPVIESFLKRAATLAGKYKNRGVPLEDLIQEANLALTMTAGMLCGNQEITDVWKELERGVRGQLIKLVDSHIESQGMENTILARTNLIHEATKVLAEEWGRLATVEELAEYTRMTVDEIRMYVDLSLNEISLGS